MTILGSIDIPFTENKKLALEGGGPVTDDKIEDVIPLKITSLQADGRFQTIEVKWDFIGTITLANYEVYASKTRGFTPSESNLVFTGKTNAYVHTAQPNETWYFRVRGINTHGNAGEMSEEATADTIRLISNDITDLAVINAKIGNLAVDNSKISNLDATKISAITLSAISADLGTVTAGELRGAFIYGSTVEGGAVRSSTSPDYLNPNFTNRAELYYGKLVVESRSALGNYGTVEVRDGAVKTYGKAALLNMPEAYHPANGTNTDYFNGGIYTSGKMYIASSDVIVMGSTLSKSFEIFPDLLNPRFYFNSSGLRYVNDTTGHFLASMAVYNRTYDQAPNVHVTSNGVIGRATSATKYKTNISEIDTSNGFAERVLDLVPKRWHSKDGVEVAALQLQYPELLGDDEQAPYVGAFYGLIAEDVEAAGLEQYVQYKTNEDGSREVEGIMYDRLWTLLIPIIKDLKEEIKLLKEGVAN